MTTDKPILPNFLIIGATKCGTTSLSEYLKQHPDIFISEAKEPRFLTSQVVQFPLRGIKSHEVEAWYVKNYDDYVDLFKNATQKAIGEASADTIYYYKDVIPVIKKYLGSPKIIIVLRDPVKRTFSAYQHLVRDEREPLSFDEALNEEKNRIADNWDPLYHYTECSLFHDSVKAYLESFDDVLVLLNEQLYKEPDAVFKQIFDFLEVDNTVKIDTEVQYNMSGVPKLKIINRLLSKENSLKNFFRPLIRTVLPEKARRKIVYTISKRNLQKQTIDEKSKERLTAYFKGDVEKLSTLLGKDLSHWMR